MENLIKKHGTKKITFCGHSAGVISAVAIYDLGPELIKQTQSIDIVTFGAPRFCDQAFQEYFDAHFKCVRCVLDRDVITLCPFGVLGYYHVGKPSSDDGWRKNSKN